MLVYGKNICKEILKFNKKIKKVYISNNFGDKNLELELQKRMDYQKPINTRITKKELGVEERKGFIRDFLSNHHSIKFTDLFDDWSKEVVIVTFLSILDMCKNNEIILSQKENFGDILIEKV